MWRLDIPTQPPERRIKNFSEVVAGFNKRQAVEEAMRCPQPAHPESFGRCPLGIDTLGFIRRLREGDAVGALQKIKEKNCLPALCGRVCPAPCETNLGGESAAVGIRALERFAADRGERKSPPKNSYVVKKQKVAVVGSGPAGLTMAHELVSAGYPVTIFEALPLAGGILRYGIPEFRLPKKILDAEIANIQSRGATIKTNIFVGQTITIHELLESGFSAVYLALGTGVPKFLGIPGEGLRHLYSAAEYLMRFNSLPVSSWMKSVPIALGRRVVVIGDSDEALDCARIGLRLGKETKLIYERSQDEMRASRQEVHYAKEEGLRLEVFARPMEILADGKKGVGGVKCIRMDFADTGSSDGWRLIPVQDSEFVVEAETVVVAAGYKPNVLISRFTPGLKINEDQTIWRYPDSFMTSLAGVFAGGGVQSGEAAFVTAMAASKKAALEIESFLVSRT